MPEKYVKRFIWQQCKGYSDDFRITYFEGLAVFTDGSQGLVNWEHRHTDNDMTVIGPCDVGPQVSHITHPIDAPRVDVESLEEV